MHDSSVPSVAQGTARCACVLPASTGTTSKPCSENTTISSAGPMLASCELPPAPLLAGTLPSNTAPSASSVSTTRGTSLSTVTLLHASADSRSPLATASDSASTHSTAHASLAMPSCGHAAARCLLKPVATTAALSSDDT